MQSQSSQSEQKKRGRKPTFVPELETPIVVKSHRIQYSSECVAKLKQFAVISNETAKKEVKNKWNIWTKTTSVREVLRAEFKHLKPQVSTYEEMLDKMYFSVRYYYCKKIDTEPKEPDYQEEEPEKSPRKYTLTPKNILEQMNSHIVAQLQMEGTKPAKAFDNYYSEYGATLPKEYGQEHYKKIYKNRFFTIRKKVSN